VPWLVAMDYHRSKCLAGDVNCDSPKLNALRPLGCSSCRQLLIGGSSPVPQPRTLRCKADAGAGTIEIDGVTVRIGRGADAKTLMVVLRALKGGR
jgi:hypothetical protein